MCIDLFTGAHAHHGPVLEHLAADGAGPDQEVRLVRQRLLWDWWLGGWLVGVWWCYFWGCVCLVCVHT